MDARPVEESPGTVIVQELLRTPAVRQLIRERLARAGFAPEQGVRELLWEDPELSLSAAVGLARSVNAGLRAAAELGRQLEKFPEPLLARLADSLQAELDRGALAEAAGVWGRLFDRLLLQDADRRARLDRAAAGLVEAGLERGARLLALQPRLARALVGFAARIGWTALRDLLPGQRGRPAAP